MSNALRTSVSDLSRSLHKALLNSDLDQNIAIKAKQAGTKITGVNRSTHPEINTSFSKTGPWSWKISFAAPSLWAGTFGNRNFDGNQFITRIDLSGFVDNGGLRGEI